MTVERDLLNDFPRRNLHVPMALWCHSDVTQTGHLTPTGRPASNGPFNFKRAIHPRMARLGSSLPFDRLQWSSASRRLYRARWRRTLPRGPSLNSPMPIRCLRGVAAFSSFPKALFQFPFSECLPFRNGPSRCNIVAVLAVALTYSCQAVCEPVPRPQDNPGCWNGRSNVTVCFAQNEKLSCQ